MKAWLETLSIYEKDIFFEKKDKRIESWQDILKGLESLAKGVEVDIGKEIIIKTCLSKDEENDLINILKSLSPWRKGPFKINSIMIDSEWRSDLKWKRVEELQLLFKDKCVLDVGSGNGYYAFRMLEKGPKEIFCLEPNLIHVIQFLAINHFIKSERIKMLPERLEDLQPPKKLFDLVFSMGVLYHQKDPISHLENLKEFCKKGGNIILETIVMPDDVGDFLKPDGRYANMPNVSYLHSKKGLEKLFKQLDLKVENFTIPEMTTLKEQRPTDWMPFSSLDKALDPSSGLTIEGHPRPRRSLIKLAI